VDGERKSLRIRQGQIVHGTSDKAGEHMGDVLVRYGLLGQADLDRAVEIVLRERKRLGAVLVGLGLLERSRVEEAIGLHAREILFNALGRPRLTCVFEELADSMVETDAVCPYSTGQLILEATRRILDPEMVRTVLGDLGRVLVLSSDPLLRTQKITLTAADGFVLSRIDGTSSARELMALVPLPSDDVERSLFSLLCTGIVDYRREATSAARTVSRTGPAAASRRSDPATGTAPTPSPATAPRTPQPPTIAPVTGAAPTSQPDGTGAELRALILALHDRLRLDHFEVLGLERSATEADVRQAYAGYARLLHPDAALDPALADLREKREEVFIRLSAAHETLRYAESRAAYESAFEPKLRSLKPLPPLPARPEPTPAPPPQQQPPAAQAAASPRPASPPATARSASPAEPEKAAFDQRLLPESILATAEELFKQANYWEAIQQLEPMIRRATGATRSSAQLLLAQAYLKNPKWKRRAEVVLQELLAENPRHVSAQLQLAEIYRATGLTSRARAAYEKVLEVEPGQIQAKKALEALDPIVSEPKRQAGLASLFRRR
jgi:tetratricopeptide (TPR) repeat protein